MTRKMSYPKPVSACNLFSRQPLKSSLNLPASTESQSIHIHTYIIYLYNNNHQYTYLKGVQPNSKKHIIHIYNIFIPVVFSSGDSSTAKFDLNTPKKSINNYWIFFLKMILYNFNYLACLSVRERKNTYATGSNGFILTGLIVPLINI